MGGIGASPGAVVVPRALPGIRSDAAVGEAVGGARDRGEPRHGASLVDRGGVAGEDASGPSFAAQAFAEGAFRSDAADGRIASRLVRAKGSAVLFDGNCR